MERRRFLLVPSQKPSSVHRRNRSADNRPFTSNSAPEKTANVRPATLGRSPSRPLSISSTEDNDEEYQLDDGSDDQSDDHSDPTTEALRTPTRPDLTSLLHSKSEKGPRFGPPPTTPANIRPTSRKVATAPAGPRRADPETVAVESSPSASKQKYQPPCGRQPYTMIAWYKKHVDDCDMCRTILSEEIPRKKLLTNEADTSVQKQRVKDKALDDERKTKEANSKEDDETDVAEPRVKDVGVALKQPGRETEYVDDPKILSFEQVSAKDVHAKLVTQICDDLDNNEKYGWIYLMRSLDKTQAGLVKIGFSTNYPQRQAQHKTRCGITAETIELWGVIDSIRRIEKLVKTDLLHLKQPWICRKCGSTHGEWFKVDEQTAIRTANMWVDWMKQKPYAGIRIKPLWRTLVGTARRPAKMFDHHDHAARHGHWGQALMEPTEDEERAFGEKEVQMVLSKQQDGGKNEPPNMLEWKDMKEWITSVGSTENTNVHVNIGVQIQNCTFNGKAVFKRSER
jgi:hypothetical protein